MPVRAHEYDAGADVRSAIDCVIEPGEYKVEITDTATKMGYVERLKNAYYDLDSIISNSIIQNQAYVTIDATDFAVRLQGVKLSK